MEYSINNPTSSGHFDSTMTNWLTYKIANDHAVKNYLNINMADALKNDYSTQGQMRNFVASAITDDQYLRTKLCDSVSTTMIAHDGMKLSVKQIVDGTYE